MLAGSIPISRAVFHQAVNNGDNVPEHYFSNNSHAESRRVEMYYSPHCLICKHAGKYILVPHANIIYANVAEPKIPELVPAIDIKGKAQQ